MLAFIDLESRVPLDHPLRTIKNIADAVLRELSPLFDAMYAEDGRPSILPERLRKASLLMSLYSIRSERAYCEQLDYHLLYRWFLGMTMVEPNLDRSTFRRIVSACCSTRSDDGSLMRWFAKLTRDVC
jgi:transposase